MAIAQALAKRPSLLLMDEPLSNLDARLRIEMREEIRRIQQETNITTVFVTHDQEEALSISDHVMVLNEGYIQQYSAPTVLYNQPENLFVAKFLGTPIINSLSVSEAINLPTLDIDEQELGQADSIGIRPENLFEVKDESQAIIGGTVRFVEIIGKNVTVHVDTEYGEIVATELGFVHEQGDKILLGVNKKDLLLFNKNGDTIQRGVLNGK